MCGGFNDGVRSDNRGVFAPALFFALLSVSLTPPRFLLLLALAPEGGQKCLPLVLIRERFLQRIDSLELSDV